MPNYIQPDPINFENFMRNLHERYGAKMTLAQRAHVQEIIVRFAEDCYRKYAAGQQEHSGNLWKKAIVLDELIKETLDLVVYAHTLRSQIAELPSSIHLGDPTLKD